jgi:alpha-galactosidase
MTERTQGLAGRRTGFWAACASIAVLCGCAASGGDEPSLLSGGEAPLLAPTPPMGWDDWAHYQCGYTAADILENAQALVATGLAARGYDTVIVDDCWMQKERDDQGNLQPDPGRFPQGIAPVAQAIHHLHLRFGVYESAGYLTCDGFAGSGAAPGGADHFLQDARLFATWGVDYLKLDGCNVYVPEGVSGIEAYRQAYATESAALKTAGRPVVFSESAPAYFEDMPEWYDVLSWVGLYGQLWREGTDIANYSAEAPESPRFDAVLWNYAYNLGRFQKPGNWNDPDFIIGGDGGMTLAETRSQLALWAMMSAPLILSLNVAELSPQAIAILGNEEVIDVDQDAWGRMATLVRRSPTTDILFKPLAGGDYALAVLNHGPATIEVDLSPADLGFAGGNGCSVDLRDLWSGVNLTATTRVQANVDPDDTAMWRLRPAPACGKPTRLGTVTQTGNGIAGIAGSLCLASTAQMQPCSGTPEETWTVSDRGALQSAGGYCLAAQHGVPSMQPCASTPAEFWSYTLSGNLLAGGECLTATEEGKPGGLALQPCGHNQANQIWSLPN